MVTIRRQMATEEKTRAGQVRPREDGDHGHERAPGQEAREGTHRLRVLGEGELGSSARATRLRGVTDDGFRAPL